MVTGFALCDRHRRLRVSAACGETRHSFKQTRRGRPGPHTVYRAGVSADVSTETSVAGGDHGLRCGDGPRGRNRRLARTLTRFDGRSIATDVPDQLTSKVLLECIMHKCGQTALSKHLEGEGAHEGRFGE